MTAEAAWNYAIGMIKVDWLEPTENFKKYYLERIIRDALENGTNIWTIGHEHIYAVIFLFVIKFKI